MNPNEVETWNDLALALVTSGDLVRSNQMTNYYWKEVASRFVTRHARLIAAAILREHADYESNEWFAEYSYAKDLMHRCVEIDPLGVWEELKPHLTSPAKANSFTTGFPTGVLDRIPIHAVTAWVSENIEERVPLIAKLTRKDLSNDSTMASLLLGSYGDNQSVASAFFSSYVYGSWTGPSSAHWNNLAEGLAEVARRTVLPKLRTWAEDSVRVLREMADRDLQREEEEELRRH